MTKTILLGGIAAVMAIGLMSIPLYADAITDLVKTKIVIDEDEYKKIRFKLAEKVPTEGEVFGGYAVFTGGDVIAVTSHKGAYDSEGQKFRDKHTTFALCNEKQVRAGLCGPEWHSHLVKPVDSKLCSFKAIGALSFQQASESLEIKAKKIILENIQLGSQKKTDSLTGKSMKFTVGMPVDADDTTAFFDGAAFDLNPVFRGDDLLAVCIGDARSTTPEPTLAR